MIRTDYLCPRCKHNVYEPPTHDEHGEPIGGGTGYVYWCLECDRPVLADELVTDSETKGE